MNNEQNKNISLLLLRIGVGLIFLLAGWGKLTNIEGTSGFFGSIGIPLPVFMAWVVALVEFFGGILVLVGAYIKYPSYLLAFIMIVAILTTKIGQDFSAYRLDIMLLAASVALALMGSGGYSVDHMLNKDAEEESL